MPRRPSADRQDNPYYLARLRSGKSVPEIAAATGYDPSTIYKIERGSLIPKEEYQIALSNLLSTPLAELLSRASSGQPAGYAYQIISILRNRAASRGLHHWPTMDSADVLQNEFNDEDELHRGIIQLLHRQMLRGTGSVKILWTGRNYRDFSPFYRAMYEQYLPEILASGVNVDHLLRDGTVETDKQKLVDFMLTNLIGFPDTSQLRMRVVRNLSVQAFVNDIYFGSDAGTIVAMTDGAFGEASLGVLTTNHQRMFDKYLTFIDRNAEDRVLYYPSSRRREFYSKYLTTESRTGDWVMLQKLPANATRPMSDYADDTKWARRTAVIEEQLGGPSVKEVIEMRRASGQAFRDRLEGGRFRQILSRQAVDKWVASGENPDLTILEQVGQRELLDGRKDIRSRIKNIVSLMDDTNGNFQIAVAEEDRFGALGWSGDIADSVAWVVQGSQATVFEGHDAGEKNAEYNVVIREGAVNAAFVKEFDDAWRSLGKDSIDTRAVRNYFLAKLEQLG